MPSKGEKVANDVRQCSDQDESVKNQAHISTAQEKTEAGESKPASDGNKTDYGYDLYPERQGGKYKPSVWEHFFLHEGENLSDQITCEKNVYNCFKKSK